MIIKLFGFLILMLLSKPIFADTPPVDRVRTIGDSVYLMDGSVYSKEEYEIQLQRSAKKMKAEEEKSNSNMEEKSIVPSWKYYTLMLAFPVFLILLFVLVFIRGRKKNK